MRRLHRTMARWFIGEDFVLEVAEAANSESRSNENQCEGPDADGVARWSMAHLIVTNVSAWKCPKPLTTRVVETICLNSRFGAAVRSARQFVSQQADRPRTSSRKKVKRR